VKWWRSELRNWRRRWSEVVEVRTEGTGEVVERIELLEILNEKNVEQHNP